MVVALAVVLVVSVSLRDGQPTYKGRTLGSWLKQSQQRTTGKLSTAELEEEPEEAIRHMGTNALPCLLKWIQCKPSQLEKALEPIIGKLPSAVQNHSMFNRWQNERHYQAGMALEGFTILGPLANPALPELIQYLTEIGQPSSGYGAEALLRTGQAGFDSLVDALSNPNQAHRWIIAYVIGLMGRNGTVDGSRAVKELVRCLQEPDLRLAKQAGEALGNLRQQPEIAVPALMVALDDTSRVPVRISAAIALAQFGQGARPALPALMNALEDPQLSSVVLETLGRLKLEPARVVPVLENCLQSSNCLLRCKAMEALGQFGAQARPVIPALIQALTDAQCGCSARAAEILGRLELEPELVVPALANCLQSGDRRLQQEAALALGRFGPKAQSALPALLKAFDTWELEFLRRYYSCDVLGKIQPRP